MKPKIGCLIMGTCCWVVMRSGYGMHPYVFDAGGVQQRIDRARAPHQLVPVVLELLGVARYIVERISFHDTYQQAWLSRLTRDIWFLDHAMAWPGVGKDGWCQVTWLVCGVESLRLFVRAVHGKDAVTDTALERLSDIKDVLATTKTVLSEVIPVLQQRHLAEMDYHRLYGWLVPDAVRREWRAKMVLVNQYGLYDQIVMTSETS